MASAVAELDGYLQSMLTLKPPGVSGTKISAITALCTANIQSESVLIQKIFTHFKKAPGSHKLGVLYVVDSVTRQWVDHARKSAQPLGTAALDGTFAAGVNRVTELLPWLLTDILKSVPEDQKARIKKLLDIWERSNTFPANMLIPVREKLDAANQSTTPDGTPSPDTLMIGQPAQANPAPPVQDTSALLAALANMAKNPASSSDVPGNPQASMQAGMHNVLGTNGGMMQPSSIEQRAGNAGSVNSLGGILSGMGMASTLGMNQPGQIPMANPMGNMANAMAGISSMGSNSNLANPLAALLPQTGGAPAFPLQQQNPVHPGSAVSPDVQHQVQLIQLMAQQGIPPDQWATALQLLNPNAPKPGAPNFGPPPPGYDDRSREGRDFGRSPPYRRRSRSPGWERRRDVSPPRRRESPVYGDHPGSPGRNRGRDRNREFRQRSPARRRSPSPVAQDLPPPGKKMIVWENMDKGTIKVLSRTLFVGGVTSSEAHLRSLFAPHGIVQTCIVNVDKRHAFVKMINRGDAAAARAAMEQYKSGDMQLRTRWGVGFGPRDCSDYQTGISIIPMERLTDADRKWMLTAEYGGTGGRPIESGMVVEEPDIEIGAGVSSKAISRRMATDSGGVRGPQSSRGDTRRPDNRRNREEERERDREKERERDRERERESQRGSRRDGLVDPNQNAAGPPVPGFGFNFANMSNLFPQGLPMNNSTPSNPSQQ